MARCADARRGSPPAYTAVMQPPILVLLAGGLGSRYGGGKQIAGVGPAGEPLLAYTLMDARKAGIREVVAVVRAEVADPIEGILAGISGIQSRLVLQGGGRRRPWGTAHALACALDGLETAAVVANADDWYGPGAIARSMALLTAGAPLALVAHRLGRTLSDSGPVNRGVCRIADGHLLGITETRGLVSAGGAVRHPGGTLPASTPVSLNLWGASPSFAPFLRRMVDGFLSTHANDEEREIGIPDAVAAWIANGQPVHAEVCDEDWCGLTHPEDRPLVVARIAQAITAGIYPASGMSRS